MSVDKIIKQIEKWDTANITVIYNLIKDLYDLCDDKHILDRVIDNLPSAELPADLDTTEVWCMDKNNMVLVGACPLDGDIYPLDELLLLDSGLDLD